MKRHLLVLFAMIAAITAVPAASEGAPSASFGSCIDQGGLNPWIKCTFLNNQGAQQTKLWMNFSVVVSKAAGGSSWACPAVLDEQQDCTGCVDDGKTVFLNFGYQGGTVPALNEHGWGERPSSASQISGAEAVACSVGGVVERPDVGDLPAEAADPPDGLPSLPYAAIGGAAAAALTVAGTWYARRRFRRRRT